MDKNEIKRSLLDKIAGKQILVIGDVMLDRFVYGAVDRKSPESDAPVLDVRRAELMAGGAANVAANLKALGLCPVLCGVCGFDSNADLLEEICTENSALVRERGRRTTVKSRYISVGGQMVRVDEEDKFPIDKKTQLEILARMEKYLGACDIVILSDYNKGVLSGTFIKELIDKAHLAGKQVLVDPKKEDYSFYAGADYITPNLKELRDVTKMPAEDDSQIEAAVRVLQERCGLLNIVVTRSEQGMSVFQGNEAPVHIGNQAREVVDVSGAGDTAIAGLAAALSAAFALDDAAYFANLAGGLVVGKAGTATISKEEIEEAVKSTLVVASAPQEDSGYKDEGLVAQGWQEAQEIAKSWRDDGFVVGFTNGCFDILHVGHVGYLKQARARCDKLIIGLNHDQSVRLLKGSKRPIHDEQARADVLASLRSVDMVVFFGAEKEGEDNTPCALLQNIRPDVFFKGGDYKIEDLPEACLMKELGGRAEIMPLFDGYSTTKAFQKLQEN